MVPNDWPGLGLPTLHHKKSSEQNICTSFAGGFNSLCIGLAVTFSGLPAAVAIIDDS
jgi:hypothetical protein